MVAGGTALLLNFHTLMLLSNCVAFQCFFTPPVVQYLRGPSLCPPPPLTPSLSGFFFLSSMLVWFFAGCHPAAPTCPRDSEPLNIHQLSSIAPLGSLGWEGGGEKNDIELFRGPIRGYFWKTRIKWDEMAAVSGRRARVFVCFLIWRLHYSSGDHNNYNGLDTILQGSPHDQPQWQMCGEQKCSGGGGRGAGLQ